MISEKITSIEKRLSKLENEGSLQATQKLLGDAKLEMNGVLIRNGRLAKQRLVHAKEEHDSVRKQLDDYIQKTSVFSWDLLKKTEASMAELQALDGRMTAELEDLMSRAETMNDSLETLPTAGQFLAVANDVASLHKKVEKLQHAGAASLSQRFRSERGRSSDRSSTSTTPRWRQKMESELERLSDEVSNLAIGVVREKFTDVDESIDREVEIRQASAMLRRRGRSTGAEARLPRNASCPAPSWRAGEPEKPMQSPESLMMYVPAEVDGSVSKQNVIAACTGLNLLVR